MGIETRGEIGSASGGSFEGTTVGVQPQLGEVQIISKPRASHETHAGAVMRHSVEIPRKEQPGTFFVESAMGSPALWEEVGADVSPLFAQVYGGIYAASPELTQEERAALPEDIAREQEQLQEDFSSPENLVVVLRDGETNNVVGFTFAAPAVRLSRLDLELDERGDIRGFTTKKEYKKYIKTAAATGATAIDPAYRGQGGWRPMMDALTDGLRAQGKYEFIERTVREDDGYDQKVRAHPGGEVVYETGTWDTYLGDQAYFRVKL